ncbi:MAG: hypothetical protein WA054_04110, partial [Candidatus Moraniibacteriota bacterium]
MQNVLSAHQRRKRYQMKNRRRLGCFDGGAYQSRVSILWRRLRQQYRRWQAEVSAPMAAHILDFFVRTKRPKSFDSVKAKRSISRNKRGRSPFGLASMWYRRYIAFNPVAKVSALLIVMLLSGVYLFPFGTQGATFTFVQTSWLGGATANPATHASNQTGWTEYASKDTNVSAVNGGADVTLTSTNYAFTDDGTTDVSPTGGVATSGGGFGNGTNASTTVTGSGTGASVGLAGSVTAFDTRDDYTVGTNPQFAAFDSSTNSVWVSNYASGNVTKLNPATGAVIGTYTVGTNPVGVLFDPSTNSIWVANNGSDTITKLNASTGAPTGTYNTGTHPRTLAFDSSTNSIWVSQEGAYVSGSVAKFNASTGALLGTYPTSAYPGNIAYDDFTNSIWQASGGDSKLYKLNAATGALTASSTSGMGSSLTYDSYTHSIWLGRFGYSDPEIKKFDVTTGANTATVYIASVNDTGYVNFDPATNTILVTGTSNNTVTRFDVSTGATLGVYSTGTTPQSAIADPSTNSIWVTNYGTNTVSKISGLTGSTSANYTVGTTPQNAVFDPSTNSVWVANYGSNNVKKLNASTGAVTGTYTVGTSPYAIAFDSSTNSVWVTNSGSSNVKKLSAADGTVTGTYTASTSPRGIAFDSSTNSIWVSNFTSNNVTKLSAADGSYIGTYPVATGGNPLGVAFDSSTNSIWIANSATANVTKLTAATGALVGTYAAGTTPTRLAFDSSTNSIWVTNSGSNNVKKLSAADGSVTGTYTVTSASGIAIDPTTSSVWVSSGGASNTLVTKLNLATGATIKTYTVGTQPSGVTFDSFTNSIWVANYSTNNITKIVTGTTTYSTPGTFTSAVIDLGTGVGFGTMSWTATLNSQTLTMKARSSATVDFSGATAWASCTDITSGAALSTGGCITDGHRYIQYQAAFSTADTAITPALNSVSIAYGQYGSGTLTSSIYNSSSAANLLSRLTWTATGTSGMETVQFQVRSAATSEGVAGATWCGYENCSGTSYFDAAESGVTLSPSHPLMIGTDDQYFQYKVILSGGAVTPVLNSVTVQYVVNAAPNLDTSFGTNGITVAQISDFSDPDWGKVRITYQVRDVDTGDGTNTPGSVTPSFAYDTGSGFTTITAPSIAAGSLTSKAVDASSYTQYEAIWDAQTDIPDTFAAALQVRVTVNDNEAANNTATATDTLAFDSKDPVLGGAPIIVDASTVPAAATFSVTDDSSLQMKVSLNADLAGASWETYSVSKTMALVTNPDTVYAQFRDTYGDETAIVSVASTETPTLMIVQDISNPATSEWRLFSSWRAVAEPSAGFASYKLYRSTDNVTFSLITTIFSRVMNYYIDDTAAFDTLYYYKIKMTDSVGNVSWFSSVLQGKA